MVDLNVAEAQRQIVSFTVCPARGPELEMPRQRPSRQLYVLSEVTKLALHDRISVSGDLISYTAKV